MCPSSVDVALSCPVLKRPCCKAGRSAQASLFSFWTLFLRHSSPELFSQACASSLRRSPYFASWVIGQSILSQARPCRSVASSVLSSVRLLLPFSIGAAAPFRLLLASWLCFARCAIAKIFANKDGAAAVDIGLCSFVRNEPLVRFCLALLGRLRFIACAAGIPNKWKRCLVCGCLPALSLKRLATWRQPLSARRCAGSSALDQRSLRFLPGLIQTVCLTAFETNRLPQGLRPFSIVSISETLFY